MSPRYRPDIDRAKGLAILLVVFGHLMAKGYPPGNAWYHTAKSIVYSFHMPFFMYLSGYVFSLAGKQAVDAQLYWGFLRDRAVRLLAPFALFGFVIVAGKYFSSFFLFVDDPPQSLMAGITALVVNTRKSPALSIWYVYVLFLYSAAMPLLWRAGLRWPAALLLGAGLLVVPTTDFLYLDRAATYFLFFAIGGFVASRPDIEPWFQRMLPFWLLLFALVLLGEGTVKQTHGQLLLCGVASIPALYGLVQSRFLARDRLLLALGGYAFSIYLLNTVVIGLTKAGYLKLKLAPFDGASATFALVLFFAAGTLVPILIRQLTARMPAVARMIRVRYGA